MNLQALVLQNSQAITGWVAANWFAIVALIFQAGFAFAVVRNLEKRVEKLEAAKEGSAPAIAVLTANVANMSERVDSIHLGLKEIRDFLIRATNRAGN